MPNSGSSRIPPFRIRVQEKGVIRDIKGMIVRIAGLPSCMYGQIVSLGDHVKGMVMGFDEQSVLALALGDQGRLRRGQEVLGVCEAFRIPVGEHLLGRMVSALGERCDQGPDFEPGTFLPVLRDSVPLTGRTSLSGFLPTGTRVVDLLFPLARGQRELLLGDRMTGKTSVAVDAILNQKGRDVVCIYCCIGKSLSGLQKVLATLREHGALEYTVTAAATDNAPVGEQFLAPFSAAAMGEYFVSRGRDVLVVFDDLTKHAWAYRQLSLLMDRPPGREAYPGDVFYMQTQLMERAGSFTEEHGGGSMTFLGIAETLQGDMTGYIPSNLVAMCDGQICFSSAVFAEGQRPAIDLGLSTSIVGGRVQPALLRERAWGLAAAHARYVEVVKLSRVSAGLSGESERVVRRGEVIRSVLSQEQNRPAAIAEDVLLLDAVHAGVLDPLTDAHRALFRDGIYAFALQRDERLIADLEGADAWTDELRQRVRSVSEAFLVAQGLRGTGAAA